MTLSRAIQAFNALQARLNRSAADRMILESPEWLDLRDALATEPARVNAERAKLQASLSKRGLTVA